jgi:SAM-dependent methyltransferase
MSGRSAGPAGDPLPQDFLAQLREVEQAYLAQDDPIKQSGYYGGEVRWRKERELILDAVEGDGDFLDVGCANGYLLQCLVEWGRERGVALTPYGVDQGAGLIALARQRHPEYRDHFWAANAWDWTPPRKFQYVYTLWACVPESYFSEYVRRLLDRVVTRGGRLIIGAYGKGVPAWEVAGELGARGFTVAGRTETTPMPITRVAWVRAPA